MNITPPVQSFSEKKVIDLFIKLALIIILLAWCIGIIMPFLEPVLWGVILAITIYPAFAKLSGVFKGKRIVPASIITAIMLIIIILPVAFLVGSVISEVRTLAESFNQNTFSIPPPDASVADWPLIGKPLFNAWQNASENLTETIITYKEPLTVVGQKVLSGLSSISSGVLTLFLAIIISGILLAVTDQTGKTTNDVARRLFGEKGDEFANIAIQTIRNVAKGILGVAFIQFVLFGISFVLAGVPFAGIWAILLFMIAIVQLPTIIVALPVIIYLFSSKEFMPALLWTLPILVASLSDNILKPWLMGKGAPVPMLVIFIGSIGGFLFSGFIGLFTGAIVLSLGYKLAGVWLQDDEVETKAPVKS
ncbi:MAG: AI-2E family transporter [Bacteroidales bacterium]|mgnify:CR=1 FL=1